MFVRSFLILSLSALLTIDALCFGGGGGGCGCGRRRKRDVSEYSEAPLYPKDANCNSQELREVMERNMAYSAEESRIALSRTLESDGDKFLVVCQDEALPSSLDFTSHYGMEFCSTRKNGHRCLAFALMNIFS